MGDCLRRFLNLVRLRSHLVRLVGLSLAVISSKHALDLLCVLSV
jgi:hypothetical protein